jgi:proline iminopeptidase
MKSLVFYSFFIVFIFPNNSYCQGKNEIVQYWDISTGSTIAYIHVKSNKSEKIGDLVFIHGGPGAYQVSSFSISKLWYQKLAAHGFDVYIYDQIGSGLSERLKNPLEYSVSRHIEDLEAIRKIINPKRFILIGDSWGATLTSNYMAKYPGKAYKAIFTSPGAIDISEWAIEKNMPFPKIYRELHQFILEYYKNNISKELVKLDSLLKSNINEAYAEFPDSKMDSITDRFINSISQRAVFNKCKATEFKPHGMGFWSLTMTNWDAVNLKTKAINTLRKDKTPVLILRGDSDYLPNGMAIQYKEVFINSQFINITDCGHFIWLDKPENYQNEIETFILK